MYLGVLNSNHKNNVLFYFYYKVAKESKRAFWVKQTNFVQRVHLEKIAETEWCNFSRSKLSQFSKSIRDWVCFIKGGGELFHSYKWIPYILVNLNFSADHLILYIHDLNYGAAQCHSW